ncbi:MAG: hypothetical protein U9N59_16580 [Campylobacterota bacterium]|nr:hypothetical protein [Campylobacterota bacterium]
MQSQVKEFLNHQDLEEQREHKLNPKSKIVKKYHKNHSKKFSGGWGCHCRFDLVEINNETIFLYYETNDSIYDLLWDEIERTKDNSIKFCSGCNKNITLIDHNDTLDKEKLKQGIAISLKTLQMFRLKIGENLYQKIKNKIELIKLLLVYRSFEPIRFTANTMINEISFNIHIEKVLLEIFMGNNIKEELSEYEKNGVNFEHIIYKSISHFANKTYINTIQNLYKKYFNPDEQYLIKKEYVT